VRPQVSHHQIHADKTGFLHPEEILLLEAFDPAQLRVGLDQAQLKVIPAQVSPATMMRLQKNRRRGEGRSWNRGPLKCHSVVLIAKARNLVRTSTHLQGLLLRQWKFHRVGDHRRYLRD